MMFESKKALLEYRGKNPKDNKLVDRWILRWEVRMVEGMYEIVDKDVIIEELKREIKSLKEWEGKNTLCSENVTCSKDATLEKRVKDLESDLDFQISENEKLQADKIRYQEAIKNSYLYMQNVLKKKMNWYDYKAIIKLEWDIKWEDNQ